MTSDCGLLSLNVEVTLLLDGQKRENNVGAFAPPGCNLVFQPIAPARPRR